MIADKAIGPGVKAANAGTRKTAAICETQRILNHYCSQIIRENFELRKHMSKGMLVFGARPNEVVQVAGIIRLPTEQRDELADIRSGEQSPSDPVLGTMIVRLMGRMRKRRGLLQVNRLWTNYRGAHWLVRRALVSVSALAIGYLTYRASGFADPFQVIDAVLGLSEGVGPQ
ncbi:MAG: hypothetical protein AAFN79_00255 [Pseudomonadota bacterium]